MVEQRLGSKTKVLYGLGAFGYGSIGQTMGSFLMFFGTGILGIPGVLMGLAVAISTVWDATTDPFVGHFSDNTKSRVFGKRHGWILCGCIAVAVINLLIWSISPAWPLWWKFSVLLGLLLLMETFCTVFSTPYGALGLDLSQNYNDRTAVQNYKTAFSFLSLLVPSVLMTIFLSPTRYLTMSMSNRGYQEIAIFTSVLCVVCGLICFFGTYRYRNAECRMLNAEQRKNISSNNSAFRPQHSGLWSDFFGIIKQKNVGRLIAGYAVSLSAGAFITTLGMHVFTYTFLFSTFEIPIIMVCLIGGIVAGQPIWFFVSKRRDKITALLSALATIIVGIIIFSAILVFRSTLPQTALLVLVAMTIFVCGVGTGCLYSLPISMFADCIFLSQQQTGIDKTAKSAGFLTFCTKISNAFIMFLIGLSLDLIGFSGSSTVQTTATQNWLGWLLIVGVLCASVGAMFIYSKYSYSKKDF